MSDDYLTMARIMGAEWLKWVNKEMSTWKNMTAMEQINAKRAFQDGFMAGFSGKYFGESND